MAKVSVRLDAKIHERLRREAQARGLTMSEVIRSRLAPSWVWQSSTHTTVNTPIAYSHVVVS